MTVEVDMGVDVESGERSIGGERRMLSRSFCYGRVDAKGWLVGTLRLHMAGRYWLSTMLAEVVAKLHSWILM